MATHQFKVYKGTPSGDIVEAVTERSALTDDQVLIDVTHSSVCGTDKQYVQCGSLSAMKEWAWSKKLDRT
jgi:threonine dehydrogenase-like Zn-dependent dehydrogenase